MSPAPEASRESCSRVMTLPRSVPLVLAADVADPAADAAFRTAELRMLLAANIAKLDPPTRQVMELLLDDLSLPEIAKRLGVGVVTVKRRNRAGLLRLAELMEDERPSWT